MALTSVITQNIPANTQSIIFNDPTEIENISYASNTITYGVESAVTLSNSDFRLFATNKKAFYTSLLLNFPSIGSSSLLKLPICKFEIIAIPSSGNLINFIQTTTITSKSIYNITFSTTALTATFAARTSSATITLQEYLAGYQQLVQFFTQCFLY